MSSSPPASFSKRAQEIATANLPADQRTPGEPVEAAAAPPAMPPHVIQAHLALDTFWTIYQRLEPISPDSARVDVAIRLTAVALGKGT